MVCGHICGAHGKPSWIFIQTTCFLITISYIKNRCENQVEGRTKTCDHLAPFDETVFVVVLSCYGLPTWFTASCNGILAACMGDVGSTLSEHSYEKIRPILQSCKQLNFTNEALSCSCVRFKNSHVETVCKFGIEQLACVSHGK